MVSIPASPRWLLAFESSTHLGGAALLRDGLTVGVARLPEGLRHGRELLPTAARLLAEHGVEPAGLWGVAVSAGPGSYTGVRVGVMAAKALAYGAGIRLAAVSSLAAAAASVFLAGEAAPGDVVVTVQDARRDEVYVGVHRIDADAVVPLHPDAAMTPEEALSALDDLVGQGARLRLAGSALASYRGLFEKHAALFAQAALSPEAAGWLGRRQLLQENSADPLSLQPTYLRRDDGAGWRHDALMA